MTTSSRFEEEPVSPTASVKQSARKLSPKLYLQSALFFLYFLIVVAYQWLGHAYTLAFGAYPDEPAHYLTSLMIHDYILSGFSQNPLVFAERFYVHYPGIAFGMWGPVFHILGAIWMLVFSDSRVSILLLVAVTAAVFAWSTQWIVTRTFSRGLGVLAGLAVCLIPSFQLFSETVMADFLTATLIFWAAYSWYRYLETGRTAWSFRFGVFATLALLTKANAGALALLPVPATLLAGRADLFRRRSFWVPIPMVVLLAGPWYVFYAFLVSNITTIPVTKEIAYFYTLQGLGTFWPATIPLVLAGIVSGFLKKAPVTAPRALWAVAASTSLGFIVYYCLVPGGFEPRYILMAAPWVAILLIIGAEWFGRAVWPHRPLVVSTALFAAIVVFSTAALRIHSKTDLPYAEVASDLLSDRNMPQMMILVSSESSVEPTFVAEIAMRDRRPNDFVLRSSKMLASMNWNGDKYESKIADEAQLRDKLRAWGISRVIIDTTPGRVSWAHHRLLRSLVGNDPQWRLTRRYGAVEVYEFQGVAKTPEKIDIEVPYTLRRTLKAQTGK